MKFLVAAILTGLVLSFVPVESARSAETEFNGELERKIPKAKKKKKRSKKAKAKDRPASAPGESSSLEVSGKGDGEKVVITVEFLDGDKVHVNANGTFIAGTTERSSRILSRAASDTKASFKGSFDGTIAFVDFNKREMTLSGKLDGQKTKASGTIEFGPVGELLFKLIIKASSTSVLGGKSTFAFEGVSNTP